MRLEGKTVIITGANSGVGATTAKAFSAEGAKLVICARRKEALDAVAEEIRSNGGEVIAVSADISKDEDCKNVVKTAVDTYGSLDVLVNNAGVLDTGLKAIDKYDDAEIQKIISVNQVGTMQMIRAALTQMKSGASIVNVASVAGYNGGGGAAYVASKSAVIGITKHTALLLAKEGIRCNAICPGTIVTPMVANMAPENLDARMMGAMATHGDLSLPPCMPEDIANILLFLSSTESRAITGQIIVTDFGVNL